MNEILFFLFGIAIGFLLSWFIIKAIGQKGGLSKEESESLKLELNSFSSELKVKESRIQLFTENIESLKNDLIHKENRLLDLQKNLAGKESDLRHLNERLFENKKDMDSLHEKFKLEFENLANKILEEKTGKFTEQNKKNLDEILNPLKDKIIQFEKKVEETHKKDIEDRASIQERIKNLIETGNKISEDAKNLTKALKGDSKTQGNWGELILESILEKSGLVKNREYFVQQSFRDESGSLFKPDVVVKFPDNRNVIIDSKVSLTAYERFVAADEPEKQEKALNDHILSIKNHIKQLSEKKYQDLVDANTLDFVMMFLPIEPAFLIAIQNEPDLWNFAYEKGIILISPTNLIAVLKMFSNFWEQDRQNRNVMEIARQSGALYDKFLGFVADLQDIDKKLDSAKLAQQNAMKKLVSGKDNLLSKVERIKKLGAKTEKELPKELFEEQS